MSHAVVRGSPTATQLAFDALLDEMVATRGGARDTESRARLTLPQVLFHCLRKYPEDLFMINADTGEKTTNHQLFSHAISLARTFLARGVKGRVVVIVHDTHKTMLAVLLGLMFAGAVPYVMDSDSTVFEVSSFLDFLQPSLVTCDARYHQLVTSALHQLPGKDPEVMLDLQGEGGDMDGFQIPDVDPDETVMLLGTSGTTGRSKAVQLTHRGMVARLPIAWATRPSASSNPTNLALVMSSSDAISFHRFITSCLLHRATLLLPQTYQSAQWMIEKLLVYRPTWLFCAPLCASALLPLVSADHFLSVQVVTLYGSPLPSRTVTELKRVMPPSALCFNVYACTETHGVVASGPAGGPLRCANWVEYKLVDDRGKAVENGGTGELLIKAPTLAKGYYKILQHESFEDNWYKTGDLFRGDGEGNLWFLERKGICFKFMEAHVSPEETEHVISSIEGVVACVVAPTTRGPAAAVVGRGVIREVIHRTVNASLSEHKRLHGGVAFVPALPTTGSGKPRRVACRALLQQMIEDGDCF